jgi:hypothetical protein
MYKITMRASGVSDDVGAKAAQDIEAAFRDHRTWHEKVACTFAGGTLTLVAFNDFDRDGRALSDEFSDCISAHIPHGGIGDGVFEVVAVETMRDEGRDEIADAPVRRG